MIKFLSVIITYIKLSVYRVSILLKLRAQELDCKYFERNEVLGNNAEKMTPKKKKKHTLWFKSLEWYELTAKSILFDEYIDAKLLGLGTKCMI